MTEHIPERKKIGKIRKVQSRNWTIKERKPMEDNAFVAHEKSEKRKIAYMHSGSSPFVDKEIGLYNLQRLK